MPWLLILGGLFSSAGGLFGWDWFLNDRKARFFVAILGRTGARAIYVVLGVLLIVLGLCMMLGVVTE
jgi:small neutral amino acid transporter SnatA (MarC family)